MKTVWLCLIVFLTACSKKEISTFDALRNQVQGYWHISQQVSYSSASGQYDTIPGTSADYMDFESDGTVQSNTIIWGNNKSAYKLLNAYYIIVNSDSLYNTTLASGNLNLYLEKTTVEGDSTAYWLTLVR